MTKITGTDIAAQMKALLRELVMPVAPGERNEELWRRANRKLGWGERRIKSYWYCEILNPLAAEWIQLHDVVAQHKRQSRASDLEQRVAALEARFAHPEPVGADDPGDVADGPALDRGAAGRGRGGERRDEPAPDPREPVVLELVRAGGEPALRRRGGA